MNPPKNINDTKYLDQINDPLGGGEEKNEIQKYLQSQGGALILEIGPGGGQMLKHSISLSTGWHRNDRYIILDIDKSILQKIENNKTVSPYAITHSIQANAIDLPFKNNVFDIINLSAVTHECSTYFGGLAGVQKLVAEISRVLKLGGVLIYRELEGVNILEYGETELINAPVRIFFDFFIKKFTNNENRGKNNVNLYCTSNISIISTNNKYTLEEYFNLDEKLKYDPQFSMILQAPAGLIREIQRHYLTFLDSYIPEFIFEETESIDQDSVVIQFEKQSSVTAFREFCKNNHVNFYSISNVSFQITRNDFSTFLQYLSRKFFNLTYDYKLFVPKHKIQNLVDYCKQKKIIYSFDNDFFELALRDIICHEEYFKEMGCSHDIDRNLLNWIKREGNESYFFSDDMNILKLFIENSRRVEENFEEFSGYTCLAPIDSKFIERKKYVSILKNQFKAVKGFLDYSVLEGKRLTHFKKMPLERAIKYIYEFSRHYDNLRKSDVFNTVIKNIHTIIRDFFSRSIAFNETFKNKLNKFPFITEILSLEDNLNMISDSLAIKQLIGKNICLVGRIATNKISFKLFFEENGYISINLTDFLFEEISNTRPTRNDLRIAGIEIRKKHGDDILARLAVEKITKNRPKHFLILDCRTPEEIKYIKENLSDTIFVGLWPDTQQLIKRLKDRYPDVNEQNIMKWVNWNDGNESDGYTNILMCLQMCDIFFEGLGENIKSFKKGEVK